MRTWRRYPVVSIAAIAMSLAAGSTMAGNLNPPPGPPAPTMKTLSEVEPRVPISALPATISQPGSYYLTRTLTASGAGDTITIQANDVTLDLNGYALDGAGVGQIGICRCGAGSLTNWVIRNGTLRNWFGSGVSAQSVESVRVENVTLVNSGLTGLILGDRARVTDTTVMIGNVVADGINVGQQAMVDHCMVSGPLNPLGRGIVTGADGVVRDSSVRSVFSGIEPGVGTTVSRCDISAISGVDSIGIRVQSDSNIEGNKIRGLGFETSGRGIMVLNGGTNNQIEGNQIIRWTTGVSMFNGPGWVVTGNLVVHNTFSDNLNDVDSGPNQVGPFNNACCSTNPWSNINY